ncbi:MAG: N-acetylneuraminate synthase [Alphaproteobacteria bacterium]|nr:N-acetylneuraminate synthase [Alphaproteobacteria bacterium]
MNCFVIAEAGVNHNGNLDIARRLIDAAADAGADAVKFQTFRADDIAVADAKKASYQIEQTGGGNQRDLLKALELDFESHLALAKHATDRNIPFASTAFDSASLELVCELGCPFLKIPSGEITNFPLIKAIASKGKPVILSTGMSTLNEVKRALSWLGTKPEASDILPAITVLHCITQYPAPTTEINLRCIETMRNDLQIATGYSDHSAGITISIGAAAMGATVIEKHFTIDRELPGPDHKASLEPDELESMVKSIRDITAALGDGIKRPMPCEADNLEVVRRSIVATREIAKGELLTTENLTVKRPAGGISPAQWYEVLGQAAIDDFAAETLIRI